MTTEIANLLPVKGTVADRYHIGLRPGGRLRGVRLGGWGFPQAVQEIRGERRTPYNDPARRPPTYVIASESTNPELPVTTQWRRDSFESMYRDGHFAHLVDLPDYQSGLEFGAQLFADPTTEYFRVFEVMRDYGMYDRSEAPQYYPPVHRS